MVTASIAEQGGLFIFLRGNWLIAKCAGPHGASRAIPRRERWGRNPHFTESVSGSGLSPPRAISAQARDPARGHHSTPSKMQAAGVTNFLLWWLDLEVRCLDAPPLISMTRKVSASRGQDRRHMHDANDEMRRRLVQEIIVL